MTGLVKSTFRKKYGKMIPIFLYAFIMIFASFMIMIQPAKATTTLLQTYYVDSPSASCAGGNHHADGATDPTAENIAGRDGSYYTAMGISGYSEPWNTVTLVTDVYTSALNNTIFWPIQVQPTNDPENYTIVSISVILTMPYDKNTRIHQGYFSVSFDQPSSSTGSAYPFSYGNWFNSSNVSWHQEPDYYSYYLSGHTPTRGRTHSSPVYKVSSVYEFDITNMTGHAFTVNDVLNPDGHFQVAWTFVDNGSSSDVIQKYDYLGIKYIFTSAYDVTTHKTDDTNKLYSVIWLLIIFLPAILVNQVIPRIGFTIGIVLMLIVIGAVQQNFFYVTLTGMLSIGIMYYKKGGG